MGMKIAFQRADLTPAERSVVSSGFSAHSEELDAPDYQKRRVKWIVSEDSHSIIAALTADILWDWIYIDELWVARELRGQGLGQELMGLAETFARSRNLQGIWLWTQSWQAEAFYRKLGYRQFTRFDNFPKGHARIGFRKYLV